MKRNFTFIIIGVFVALLTSAMCINASGNAPVAGVYYYLKMDTAGIPVGYLQVLPAKPNQFTIVSNPQSDYALWQIFQKTEEAGDNLYRMLNKATGDTMAFNVAEQTDTIAIINSNGVLNKLSGLFDNIAEDDSLKTYLNGEYYYLSFSNDSVFLSRSTSEKTALTFTLARQKSLPVDGKYYRLKVDTAGVADPVGYLRADTAKLNNDSLAITKIFDGGLSLWKFETDTIVADTTYFKIYNKETGKMLAFNPIIQDDSIASVDDNGDISDWIIPFFTDNNNKGRLMVRDTLNNKEYFLGLDKDTVKLISNTTRYKYLTLLLEEDMIMPDSVVYKVKYLNEGDSAGLFYASNEKGEFIFIDSVYAHIPNGQFVVHNSNRYNLMSRMANIFATGKGSSLTDDSLKYVIKSNVLIPNQYAIGNDTVEITKVEMGAYKNNSKLGYKYFSPEEIAANSFIFTQVSVDTLPNRIMGYDVSDSLVMILNEGDSTRFTANHYSTISAGAPEIAGIPSLSRETYHFGSIEDSTIFITKESGKIMMKTVSNTSYFFLKEDTIPGNYYFIDNNANNIDKKIIIDSTKYLSHVNLDSIVTHSFSITFRDRRPPEEPDPYTYLTALPSGAGFYEFLIFHPLSLDEKHLSKNVSDYAFLGKEGESMLRAGSYIPSDLQLWADTARGSGYNPLKPSFYIVKDVDTTATNFNKANISGYFLHVMDSIGHNPQVSSIYMDAEGDEYNRANFVKAKRITANELLLDNVSRVAEARDSVGFAGKNEDAINEYRFFLQNTGDGMYYLVTEDGYGDGSSKRKRGYLSFASDTLYFGLRDADDALIKRNLKVRFRTSTVSNEIIPPIIEEQTKKILIYGGTGQINIKNAAGEEVIVYNILGQPAIKKALASDNENIPATRGIMIVRIGLKAQKVVVK